MTLVANLIWLVCGGLLACALYFLGGLVLCATIVGIPFGVQKFKLGIAGLAPFGKVVVERDHANSLLRLVLNGLWAVTIGWGIALNHLVWALLLAVTVVGMPFAVQHIKLLPLALFPFGRDLVLPR